MKPKEVHESLHIVRKMLEEQIKESRLGITIYRQDLEAILLALGNAHDTFRDYVDSVENNALTDELARSRE